MMRIIGWIDTVLSKISEDFVPFFWGLSVGIFIAGSTVTAINFYHLKKDCNVIGAFRIDNEAFACKPVTPR
jgi:hypothetical protein